MATTTLTPDDLLSELGVLDHQHVLPTLYEQKREALERLQVAERQLRTLQATVRGFTQTIALHERAIRDTHDEHLRHQPEQSFAQLLSDESYGKDSRFSGSNEDFDRLSAFTDRTETIERLDAVRDTTVLDLENLRTRESTLTDKRTELATIQNAGWATRIANFRRVRALREEIARLEGLIAASQPSVARWEASMQQAETQLSELRRNEPYDGALLHGPSVRADTLLPRSVQSVAFSMTLERGVYVVKLHLPQHPEATDLGRTVTFQFAPSETEEIIELLGATLILQDEDGLTDPLYQLSQENREVSDIQLVPLALELVTIDGKQTLRLPQAVWERFCAHQSF